MLDSSTITIAPFKDNRTKRDPKFVGMSGKLLLGTDTNGKKYLIPAMPIIQLLENRGHRLRVVKSTHSYEQASRI